MKKLIGWSLLLALLLTVGLTGCGGGSGAADDDNGEDGGLAEKAVIKWGTNAAFPPFESINPQTGEVEGFDKDLADIIGEELGVEMEVVDTSFETLFAGLESKKYDLVIAGVTIKTSRLEKMDFSDPYYEAGQVIVVRADYDEIEDEYDLPAKRIESKYLLRPMTLSAICRQARKIMKALRSILRKKRYDNHRRPGPPAR